MANEDVCIELESDLVCKLSYECVDGYTKRSKRSIVQHPDSLPNNPDDQLRDSRAVLLLFAALNSRPRRLPVSLKKTSAAKDVLFTASQVHYFYDMYGA